MKRQTHNSAYPYRPVGVKFCWQMALMCFLLLIPWSLYAGDKPRATDLQISDYLIKADQALASDRLTTPAGDNAVAYIEQALAIAPEHPGAMQLLQRITKRYGELVTISLKRGEQARQNSLQQAQIFRDRANNVISQHGITDSALLTMDQKLEKYGDSSGNGNTAPRHTQVTSKMAVQALLDQHITLSESALDRTDIEEAQWHIRQADAVLERYRLSSSSVQSLKHRVSSVAKIPAHRDSKETHQISQGDTERRIRDLIHFHVTLGERALSEGNMDKAQQHKLFAEELASQYGIEKSHVEAFSLRVVEKDLWLNLAPKLRLFGTF